MVYSIALSFPRKFVRLRNPTWILIVILLSLLVGFSFLVRVPTQIDTIPKLINRPVQTDPVKNVIPALSGTSTQNALTQVPRYGVFEITLTASGDYSNPYLEMPGDNSTPGFVVGTFTGPKGEEIAVDGFWDGGKTWKIRMAPMTEGIWTYVTASSDIGLDGQTGQFECTASNSKGFVQVDPNNPHHFMFQDGTPMYWAPVTMMIAHFDLYDGRGGQRRLDNGTFQEYVHARAGQGFNATHWGYYGFSKYQFNNGTQQNEGGPPFENYDPDLLNPAYYQFGDERMRLLLDEGIIPELTLGWPDQGILVSIGETRLKRYWRYLIARYTAYSVVYNLFGEVQEFGSDYLSIANDFAQLTRNWDPYGHLLTTHTLNVNQDPAFINQPWLDFISLQQPPAKTSDYLKYGKPIVNTEYDGYESGEVNAEELRPLTWEIRMRGGYFVYETWGDDLYSKGAEYVRLNNTFFQDQTDFWKLEYHPELFDGKQGLADPGHEYVVYLSSGGKIGIDLTNPNGMFTAEWYNPRSGGFQSAGNVDAGTIRSFEAPTSEDWVLHLSLFELRDFELRNPFLPSINWRPAPKPVIPFYKSMEGIADEALK